MSRVFVCWIFAAVFFCLGVIICGVFLIEWLYKENERQSESLRKYNKWRNQVCPVFLILPFIQTEKVIGFSEALWLEFGWLKFRRRVLLYRKRRK